MGEWYKVKPPDHNNPCANCQVGWSSYQSRTNENGELETKTDSCSETCERFREYYKSEHSRKTLASREHFPLGENIRDAIRSIKGG